LTSLERFVEIDATPVTDADGIIGSCQFLDHGTTNRVADFSDKDFGDGLVFAVNFKGHSRFDTVFGTDGENGDAEFALQADDAGVLQITHGLATLTTACFDECGISLRDRFIETISGRRVGILSAFHQAQARFSEFNQSVGEFIALLFHDAQVAESGKQTILGLILVIFECPNAETFEQTAQFFVTVFELAGFSIGSSGALSERVVLILGCKKLSILSLDLCGGNLKRDVQFLIFEFVIRTQTCHAHCKKQRESDAGDGSAERHEELDTLELLGGLDGDGTVGLEQTGH